MNVPVQPPPQAKVPAPVRPINPVTIEPFNENPPAPVRMLIVVVPPKVAPPVILIVPVPEMLPEPVLMRPP